jgi:signal transduction histidine kinase
VNTVQYFHDSAFPGLNAPDRATDIIQPKSLLTFSEWSHPNEPSPNYVDALQEIVSQLPDQFALLDRAWTILALSRDWAREAAENGYSAFRVGANYIQICNELAKKGDTDAAVISSALQRFADGDMAEFECLYAPSRKRRLRYRLSLHRFTLAGAGLALLSRTDVTDIATLTEQCRSLEETLIAAQEVERRRIGRELHDSTSQLLVVLQLSLMRLKGLDHDAKADAIIGEMGDVLHQINSEIRATSYLLHPPSPEDGGVAVALRKMVEGFGRRTGLKTVFESDGSAEIPDPLIERTLYRVAQEAIANVHRHARASRVEVRLIGRETDHVHLIIDDDGVGIPPEAGVAATGGVGISSMRTRMRELGGRLGIYRAGLGGRVIASVPLEQPLMHRRRRQSIEKLAP